MDILYFSKILGTRTMPQIDRDDQDMNADFRVDLGVQPEVGWRSGSIVNSTRGEEIGLAYIWCNDIVVSFPKKYPN